MNSITLLRRTKIFTQINNGKPSEVFPLLCPVREKDWIDGWEYSLIYSESGLAEKGCVFTTPSSENKITTWYVTEHDPQKFLVEFVRMTPGEMTVRISIQLSENNDGTTASAILYEYTALSEEANQWIEKELDSAFHNSMSYWEKAINHYLQTGEKLLRS
jgi:hypothetical protein